ncbi:hypothetical protein C8Q77DRAFT_691832 [Trametes polyzona]|nr:hypothetical protein C8Q77DRAFT_691832 [Trametes polyzona]
MLMERRVTIPFQAAMQLWKDCGTPEDCYISTHGRPQANVPRLVNAQIPGTNGSQSPYSFSRGAWPFGPYILPQYSRSTPYDHVVQVPSAHALWHPSSTLSDNVPSGAYTHSDGNLHGSFSSSSEFIYPSSTAHPPHETPRLITSSRSIHSDFPSERVPAPTGQRNCEWNACGIALPDAQHKTIRRHLKECHFPDNAPSATTMVVCRWGENCRREPMRWENLAKHIVESHTTPKVICRDCGTSFARRDTLKRHVYSGYCPTGASRTT